MILTRRVLPLCRKNNHKVFCLIEATHYAQFNTCLMVKGNLYEVIKWVGVYFYKGVDPTGNVIKLRNNRLSYMLLS
jgi:hypothetical protein